MIEMLVEVYCSEYGEGTVVGSRHEFDGWYILVEFPEIQELHWISEDDIEVL